MSKSIDLVIRITVPVNDNDVAAHCREAWDEGRPLLAIPEPLAEHVEDFVFQAREDGVCPTLALEPGREPGRPMTRAEAELFERGVQAGMALTMEASGLHVTDDSVHDHLTEMECLLADYTGQDYEDYAEGEAARRLLRLIRCEWVGGHWQTMTPGNEPARQATLDAPKPWDHSDQWGDR